MDWITSEDIHKRFKLFQQRCELIFKGPLDKVEEANKVRLLLLWIGDKRLEIYNTTTWASNGDNLNIDPVIAALEAYTKPQSNRSYMVRNSSLSSTLGPQVIPAVHI